MLLNSAAFVGYEAASIEKALCNRLRTYSAVFSECLYCERFCDNCYGGYVPDHLSKKIFLCQNEEGLLNYIINRQIH